MPTSTSLATLGEFDASAILARARAARRSYDDAVCSDGTSAAAWSSIRRHLDAACCELIELHLSDARPIALTPSVVQQLVDRARDAGERAQVAERMVSAARSGRVIDMSSLAVCS